jgi:hypothetical protein
MRPHAQAWIADYRYLFSLTRGPWTPEKQSRLYADRGRDEPVREHPQAR